MQFKKTILCWIIFITPAFVLSQSTPLPLQSKYQQLLERLSIKFPEDASFKFTTTKPYSRKVWTEGTMRVDSLRQAGDTSGSTLSRVDQYMLRDFQMNNSEWYTGDKSDFAGRRPIFKAFYTRKANFLEVDQQDFFLAVNPVIQQVQSKETNNDQRIFLNSKGLSFRGLIAKKIGFDFYLTDNQERPPLFVQKYVNEGRAVPGAGFYKPFKTTAYDYFDGRGSIYFNVTRYINVQFGYDRNFIGNGYRSLMLSDFATNYLFLKLNTRIWKLNYQNLFMELTAKNLFNNQLNPKKYASMHHLDIDVTRWLNIGLFESIIFGRQNKYELGYLNPVIFLRSIEQQNGSPDNALLGFDFKATVAKRLQFYGQFVLDEFVLKEARAGNGWWGNKFAVQLGGKYIDAFSIRNLDLQGELNFVRPFTYSKEDSVANYSHYGQPLAHPLGANLQEGIGILRYQPAPKWQIQAKLILFRQGYDTSARSYGGNIFRLNTDRVGDYGYSIGSGARGTGANASLWLGYEVLENLFIDASILYRKLSVPSRTQLSSDATIFSIGLRLNASRREYDY